MSRTSVKGGLTVELDGLAETLRAVRSVEAELRPEANGLIRDAAGQCASELLPFLEASASSSGVPVAPRVARSIRVKRDRMPTVSIGGSTPVGRGGARAGALVWGSEKGPSGGVNHFAVPPAAGYWIAPATAAFKDGRAIPTFQRALVLIFKRYGLL
jgi:hypothetical protein